MSNIHQETCLDSYYNPKTKVGLTDLVAHSLHGKKATIQASTQQIAKPKLTVKNLAKFTAEKENGPFGVPIADLDYPCNDKSIGIKDFADWNYFQVHKNVSKVVLKELIEKNIQVQKAAGIKHPKAGLKEERTLINKKSANLWCDKLLDKIEKQAAYVQEPVYTSIPKVKETKIHKLRMKRAKLALAKWMNPDAAVSIAGATKSATISPASSRMVSRSPSRQQFSRSSTISELPVAGGNNMRPLSRLPTMNQVDEYSAQSNSTSPPRSPMHGGSRNDESTSRPLSRAKQPSSGEVPGTPIPAVSRVPTSKSITFSPVQVVVTKPKEISLITSPKGNYVGIHGTTSDTTLNEVLSTISKDKKQKSGNKKIR